MITPDYVFRYANTPATVGRSTGLQKDTKLDYYKKFGIVVPMTNFVRILPQTARDCSTPDCVTYPAMNLTGSEGISAQYYTTICKICHANLVLCWKTLVLQNWTTHIRCKSQFLVYYL